MNLVKKVLEDNKHTQFEIYMLIWLKHNWLGSSQRDNITTGWVPHDLTKIYQLKWFEMTIEERIIFKTVPEFGQLNYIPLPMKTNCKTSVDTVEEGVSSHLG